MQKQTYQWHNIENLKIYANIYGKIISWRFYVVYIIQVVFGQLAYHLEKNNKT